jgi:hypothetical protein
VHPSERGNTPVDLKSEIPKFRIGPPVQFAISGFRI